MNHSEDDSRHNGSKHHHDDGVVVLWKLNVQGVTIETRHPEIRVRQAIKEAGYNPDTPWIIILKIEGQPKKEVDLDFTIDLRHPGIEKLRLTPRQINNGEGNAVRRREFDLLPQDENHLDRLRVRWETIVENGRRWLILRDYRLPPGFRETTTHIAVEVPISYPGARLDMFYCWPRVTRVSGANIPQTEHVEAIEGKGYQRWSRHRDWDPAKDTLATHLTLIDEALQREVEG